MRLVNGRSSSSLMHRKNRSTFLIISICSVRSEETDGCRDDDFLGVVSINELDSSW